MPLARRALATLLLAGVALFTSLSLAHAQGDATVGADFSGPCEVTATINENGEVIDPASSGGVYEAPVQGSAVYSGSISVPAEERAFNGQVTVQTPPPFPGIVIKTWEDDDGDNVSDAGTVTWDLPRALPRGVIVTVGGFHQDAGARCEGSIQVQLEGGFFDSPIGAAAAALTVLGALGLLWASVPAGSRS